jgi:hypothetical protein
VEPTSNQVPNGTSISPCIKIVIDTGGLSYFLSEIGSPSLRMVTEVVFSGASGSTVTYSFSCWCLS